MKKHEEKKNNRRWVVRAMVSFVVILAVLTFFSNTIMNLTIPLVVATTATRGNLSYTNNATAQIVADGEVKVNGIQDRVVEEVVHTNYDLVEEGEVILRLAPVENTDDLTNLENDLLTAQRNLEYAYRAPNHPSTFYTEQQAVRTAENALAEAQATLSSATNSSDTVAAAQQVLNTNQAAVNALTPQIAAATVTVETINAQIALDESRLNMIDQGQTVYVQNSMNAARPAPLKGDPDPNDPNATTTTTTDTSATTTTDTSATTTSSDTSATSSSEETTTSASATETAAPTATPAPATPTPGPAPSTMDRAAIESELAQLRGQLATEQARLDSLTAQLAASQAAVTAAQEIITTAQGLPSTYAAQDAVADAQAQLQDAQIRLSDAQINAAITADKANDQIEDYIRQIAILEDKIAKKREQLMTTEIVAPCAGYVFNLTAAPGDKLVDNVLAFSIIPEVTTYSATFTFRTDSVSGLNVGDTLTSNNYFVQSVVVTNIKPDPNSPRDNRLVKCAITSTDGTMWPGESITVTADRSNQTFDHVIAASAVSEDNTGTYVYVVDKTSGPLGDRYVVRRISVTVQEGNGSLVAISGQGLDDQGDLMIVTRSEEPLHNGDRVRLEDYSGNSNGQS